MSDRFQAIIAELRGRNSDPPAGKVVTGEVLEWCPFHPDGQGKPPHTPSLRLERSKEVYFCDPCDKGGTWTELEDRLGISRNGHQPKSSIVDTYDYPAEDTELLFQVVRFEPKDFRQRRPDGSGGWVWKLDGVRRVLYRLPETLSADPKAWVFVVEGEKDADRLAGLGVVATTNAGGAGKWRDDYSETLRGRRVAIIPDHDDAGLRHADEVAQSLKGIAADVRIVKLPAKEIGDDVSDWLDQGGTKEDLIAMAEAADNVLSCHETLELRVTQQTFQPVPARDFLAEPDPEGDDWLLEGRIPAGGLTLLVSPPKTGKSRFARQLCQVMERGGEFCGVTVSQGRALYLALEERPSDVRHHLRALGASETLIWARPFRLTVENLALLSSCIREYDLKLVVIDTLNRAWVVESSSDRRQTDAALTPLIDIAHTLGCAVLLLHHTRKAPGEDGADVAESNDIVAAADQVVYLRRDNKNHPNRRVLRAPGIGRYPPATDLLLEFNEEGIYLALGEAGQVQGDEERTAILDVIDDTTPTKKEIVDATELSEPSVRRRLQELQETGVLSRTGRGVAGDPYRYRVLSGEPLADDRTSPEAEKQAQMSVVSSPNTRDGTADTSSGHDVATSSGVLVRQAQAALREADSISAAVGEDSYTESAK